MNDKILESIIIYCLDSIKISDKRKEEIINNILERIREKRNEWFRTFSTRSSE